MVWIALIGVTVVIGVEIALTFKRRADVGLNIPKPLSLTKIAPLSKPSSAVMPPAPPLVKSPAVPRRYDDLKTKYGADIEVILDGQGRFSSLKGGTRPAPTDLHFNPGDPRSVAQRAKEVLSDIQPLLELDPHSDMGPPQVQASATLAQVEFQQSLGGVPMMPAGSLSIDLGAQGEVLGVYAHTWAGVELANTRVMSAASARAGLQGRWEGGRSLIYVVAGSREGMGSGHHAIEFNSRTERVILDASNGHVLERRDIRHF